MNLLLLLHPYPHKQRRWESIQFVVEYGRTYRTHNEFPRDPYATTAHSYKKNHDNDNDDGTDDTDGDDNNVVVEKLRPEQ